MMKEDSCGNYMSFSQATGGMAGAQLRHRVRRLQIAVKPQDKYLKEKWVQLKRQMPLMVKTALKSFIMIGLKKIRPIC